VDIAAAHEYLDAHASYERTGRIESPSLDRIRRLVTVIGDPQHAAPVIHITGTNGKGSTAQMVTRLLMANGLKVGTCTSPHLERLNERMALDGEPISDEELAEQIAAIGAVEPLVGARPSYFEICTAAAFRWFADVAVDVMVVEVGLLGRWDATNVVDADIAVVTNIGLDHTELAGPTKAHIAREKAGIIKPSSVAVIGETDPSLVEIFLAEPAAGHLVRDEHFATGSNQLAVGGRLAELRTPSTIYPEVLVPLHGAHQADNAAVALTATEAFFGAPLDGDIVAEGFASVKMPGRFEIVGRQPLVIIDGAHNPAGADVCSDVFLNDFDPAGRRILVVGCLRERDPAELLGALRADEFDRVVCCTAPSPRGRPADELAAAARRLGCDDVVVVDDVGHACNRAINGADGDDAVLVTGSLYVVGAARHHLVGRGSR
jgi:dihydrofolate synthase / folylpolyglutamate synthase